MEISTSKDIDPNEVMDHRTDVTEQYNDSFVDTEAIDELWKNGNPTSTFKFSEYGTDFGTREMGAKLRKLLLPLLTGENCIALDFKGVNVVSYSFAAECIAKLLLELPITELKKHITFCNLNPTAERSILVALQRRYKVTAS